MISGKIALGDLSLEFGNAKKRFAETAEELAELTKREEKLLDREEKVLHDLARIYLPDLSPDSVSGGLTDLRSAMQEALLDQSRHRTELERRIAELPEIISSHELLLAQAERGEEIAADGLERVRALVEQELRSETSHSAAVEEHQALMERRSVVASRRIRLKTMASVERKRYDEDKAFAYLRSRGYGEPGYRAGPVSRRLDGWLARRIGYDRLLLNYRILTSGPQLMQLELRDLSDQAKLLETEIDRRESSSAARHGLGTATSAVKASHAAVRDARVTLSESRERHDRLAAEIRAVDANRGRPYEDALARHRDFLASSSVEELLEIARSTPDPMDDGLVDRLSQLRAELAEVGDRLEKTREDLEGLNRGTTGLGDLLRKASEHFSSRRSFFSEEMNLGRLVNDIIHGGSDSDQAFSSLEAAHIKRPLLEPDHASELRGLFADIAAQFDDELGAVEVKHADAEIAESEVVVYDHQGRVLHRRITRRSPGLDED